MTESTDEPIPVRELTNKQIEDAVRSFKYTDEFADFLRDRGEMNEFKTTRQAIELRRGLKTQVAWGVAAIEYGWFPEWTPADAPMTAEETKAEFLNRLNIGRVGKIDMVAAVTWAAENALRQDSEISDSPSGTATLLLVEARKDSTKFLAFARNYLKADDAGDEIAPFRDDAREGIELLDEFLTGEVVAAEIEAEAIKAETEYDEFNED